MTQEESFDVLVQAFSALKQRQIKNFAYHLRRETPILCSDKAKLYVDEIGGG